MTDLDNTALDRIERDWREAFPRAVRCWSRYLELGTPRFSRTVEDDRAAGLGAGFIRARYTDRTLFVSLPQVAELGIGRHPEALLAHAIGHLVLAPGDLDHHARLLARVRAGLDGQERFAPLVANVWADLMVDAHLHEQGIDISEAYRQIAGPTRASSPLLRLHLRAHEILTGLPAGSLVEAGSDPDQLELDARLVSQLIRTHRTEWLSGATRFALIARPRLVGALRSDQPARLSINPDVVSAGEGQQIPTGLATLDWVEQRRSHPADDPRLTGLRSTRLTVARADRSETTGRARFRPPAEYLELLATLGIDRPRGELVARYYRERAQGHPPISSVGKEAPSDLLLALDAAPSSLDPGLRLSAPALLGVRLALETRRQGGRVAVVWSTAPHAPVQATVGFTHNDEAILEVLTRPAAEATSLSVEQVRHLHHLLTTKPGPTDLVMVADHRLLDTLNRNSRGHTTGAWALIAEMGQHARCRVIARNTATRSRSGLRSFARHGWQVQTAHDDSELLKAVA